MSLNHSVFFEAREDFFDFILCAFLFKVDVVVILLNFTDSVDGIQMFKKDIAVVSILVFLHCVDFASKKVGKFVSVRAAFERRFFFRFY